MALRAAQSEFADLAPLRSVMVSFIGPVTQNAVFIPALLRQGKNVTTVSVDVVCDGQIGARVALVFGKSRESDLKKPSNDPKVYEAPDSYPLFTPPEFRAFVPKFFNNFETTLIAGSRPMSGAEDGFIHAWSRHADPASRAGIDSLVTIGDVLPPAAYPLFTRAGAVSSVTWMLNILVDTPDTEDGWWRVDTRLSAAQNGYSSQTMGIWNTAGRKVAEGMQSVAIFIRAPYSA